MFFGISSRVQKFALIFPFELAIGISSRVLRFFPLDGSLGFLDGFSWNFLL
jgi:hypothetical protein